MRVAKNESCNSSFVSDTNVIHPTPRCSSIFSSQIAAQGAFTQSIIVTTIYATLGMDAVIDAVQECKISAILCNKINVKILMERIKEMPTLKHIIYTNDLVAPDSTDSVPDYKGAKVQIMG